MQQHKVRDTLPTRNPLFSFTVKFIAPLLTLIIICIKALPRDFTSSPAMELRLSNLWDNVDGSIEQGFSGRSLLWPMALLADDRYIRTLCRLLIP